ncbi:MAG: NAD(P)-dependent alcohol dehydrogenase [Actinomycetota bacterium]|nr:NAD(P)-dependent alcohol dehydrogenase [Actinomycetota bacterium]
MRASVLRGVHDVAVEERPMPEVGPGDVLVRVGSVGVCGSDVHYYEHGRIGSFVVDAPLILGHEAGGLVVELGADVDGSLADRRVSLEPGIPCRSCAQCLGGHYNLCPDVRFFATPPIDGAFCEYVAVPAAFAYPVPDEISDDAAGLLEPLSVGVWACRRSAVAPGTRVLVTGAGPIGLVAASAARAFGATEVVVTDVNEHRLALAAKLGLTPLDVTATSLSDSGFQPDVLIECSGSPQATGEAIRTVARAGRVVLVGMGPDEIPLPLSYVQDRELLLVGAFRYANTWPTAIALAAAREVELDALVTGHYGLDEVEDALTAARRDPTAVKPVVRPGQAAGRGVEPAQP